MQGRWLRSRVFVVLSGETFRHPYVHEFLDLSVQVVARRHFTVHDLVECGDGLGEVRLFAHSVDAWLVGLVERHRRHGILRVLEPDRHALVVDAERAVHLLYDTNKDLIAPIEYMGVLLRNGEGAL